jgi:hypothetical protein
MSRLFHSVVVAASAMSFAGLAQGQEASMPPLLMQNQPDVVQDQEMRPRFAVVPYQGPASPDEIDAQSAAAATIPLWSKSIKLGAKSYIYQMVGKNPTVKQVPASVAIKAVIVPIVFTFKNSKGKVVGKSDPTAADPTCSPHGTPLSQVLNSPVLKNITNFKAGNVNLGSGQYVSLFQRANFYKYTKTGGLNPGYQVTLSPVVTAAAIPLTVNGASAAQVTPCGSLQKLSFNSWDQLVQTSIFPLLAQSGYGPTTLPIFLFYNVVLTDVGCCILGYHSAFNNPNFGNAFQTYSVVDYDTTKFFTGTSDVSALSHEIAEWMDDPSGVNPTPPWGHIGQVAGCQSNLEVGDPLTGNIKKVVLNGFAYHVQDLAFWSWFYQQASSIGVNGWYSLYGIFRTPSTTCH